MGVGGCEGLCRTGQCPDQEIEKRGELSDGVSVLVGKEKDSKLVVMLSSTMEG
jgi:hypothetical protein